MTKAAELIVYIWSDSVQLSALVQDIKRTFNVFWKHRLVLPPVVRL
jgi:hypothetical protein